MSDEPRDARPAAPPTLREYLADRDVSCEQCGYNLRGAQDVFCPECGAVIPRPPAEHIARTRIDPSELKLCCPECEYVVTGVNAERCPECGGRSLTRFVGVAPPRRHRILFRPRGLPLPLWLNTVFGALVLLTVGARSLAEFTGSRSGGAVVAAAVALLPASVPLLIAMVWMWNRGTIQGASPRNRRIGAAIALVIGLMFWIFALLIR